MILSVPEDLCLDYANTLSWRGSARPVERLERFSDVAGFMERSGAASPGSVRRLGRWPADDEDAAAALLAEAVNVREVLFRVLGAIAVGAEVAQADLRAFNAALAETPARRALAPREEGFAWKTADDRASLPLLLAPVLWSAADLLVRSDRARIRRCANPECLWLFLDRSKTGTRRWCDMSSCGNRAKARRHYARVRAR